MGEDTQFGKITVKIGKKAPGTTPRAVVRKVVREALYDYRKKARSLENKAGSSALHKQKVQTSQ